MKVGLITTGKMELLALPAALKELFGAHEFLAIPMTPPSTPFNGMTSLKVVQHSTQAKSNAALLIEAATGALFPERRGGTPRVDAVIIVDDVELVNVGDEQTIVTMLREALVAHLRSLSTRRGPGFASRRERAFRERVSFHLALPMAESWILADEAGPRHVGVPASALPSQHQGDPEAFQVNDERYLSDRGCPAWTRLSDDLKRRKRKTHKPAWLRTNQDRHPKAYLAWLCRDDASKKCSTYRESGGGVDALRQLDWRSALRDETHMRYLRALVEDLADLLDEPLPAALQRGEVAALTSRHQQGRGQLLRNV